MSTKEVIKFESKLVKKKTLEEISFQKGQIKNLSQLNQDKKEKLLHFADKFLFNN